MSGKGRLNGTPLGVIGYARCSTVLQDLAAQREILTGPGVPRRPHLLGKGLTGASRAQPGRRRGTYA